ncbi:hypothetical protein [Streptomyces sp. NPDC048172]|uniref:hypothetical protein n=1 Tax=Streptomyces sp. NPDC048172 TaxID=3365505 RepID=UPI00372097D8
MMPPNCALCRVPPQLSEFESKDFTLVYFRSTVTYPDDWAGHPENAEWFCPTHLPLTEGLTHLPALDAMRLITAKLRGTTDQGS